MSGTSALINTNNHETCKLADLKIEITKTAFPWRELEIECFLEENRLTCFDAHCRQAK